MPERSFSVRLSAVVTPYVNALRQAQTATGKFATGTQSTVSKAGASFGPLGAKVQAVGSKFQALGPLMQGAVIGGVTAAGAAIAGLAIDSVKDFQRIALGAGELRDRLGVTAEEASRLQEVAGDLGIPVDTLASTINRMNRAAEDTPAAFDNIGASVARSADGAVDVNQTFLNTVEALDSIPNASARAAAAQEIFGRGWLQIAELVGEGADGLKARLDAVGDSKIATDGQIAQARLFRDNVDDVNDAVSSFTEQIGSGLVPVLNDLIGIAKAVGSAIASIPFKDQALEIAGWVTGIKPLTMGLSKANEVLEDMTGTTHGSVGAMASYKGELSDAEQLLFDYEVAQRQADDRTADMYESATEAAPAVNYLRGQQEDAAAAAQEHAESMQEAGEKAQAMSDAFRAASDAGFALRQAQRAAHEAGLDLADAEANLNEVMEDGESTKADVERAYIALVAAQVKVLTSANDVADAEVRQAKERKTARGETMSATQALDVFNRSLVEQAAQADGPTRAALIAHIAELNNIPPKKASEIAALIEEGKLREAKRKLKEASDPRTATVTADAQTSAAKAELDELDNPRTMDLIVNPRLGGPIPLFAAGGTVGSPLAMVGERGPEVVSLPVGSFVHNAARTRSMLGGIQSFANGGRVAPDPGLQMATRTSPRVASLLKQAADLAVLADMTEDAEERLELLEQATEKAERAADLHAKSIGREADQLEKEADRLRNNADALRDAAEAAREAGQARSEALLEQASSLRGAVDANFALTTAQRAATAAAAQATEAHRTFGLTGQERAEADQEAAEAALRLADAQVELARQRAGAQGKTLSAAEETDVFQRSLRAQQAGASPELRGVFSSLIESLRIPATLALQHGAARALAAGDRQGARLDARAVDVDKHARAVEKVAKSMDRFADRLDNAKLGRIINALVKAREPVTRREIERALRGSF